MLSRKCLFFYIISAFVATWVLAQNKIAIKPGNTAKIQNKGYPKPQSGGGKTHWKLETSPEAFIKLECDKININPADKSCKNGNLTLDPMNSGKRHFTCDKLITPFTLVSIKNNLDVILNLDKAEGTLSCIATALKTRPPVVQQVQFINLKLQEEYDLKLNPVRPYEHNIWNFKTEKGHKIVVACSIFVISTLASSEDQQCAKFEAKFIGEKKTERYCKSTQNLKANSDSETLSVSIRSDAGGSGLIECKVKSAMMGTFIPFRNIASEEFDSSEHGSELVPGTSGKTTSCNCGYANKDRKRVIYGYDAGQNEYPWMVSLQEFRGHFCGGSIITEYHVISAAHCTKPRTAQYMKVVVGVNNYKDIKGGQEIKVQSIINHDYDDKTYSNDISLLVLEKKIIFSNKVGPVCIPKTDPHPSKIVGQYVTGMGWGRHAPSETTDQSILKETKLRAVDLFSCNIDWNYTFVLDNPSLMCTFSSHTDICIGDSGGPIVWLDPEINRYVLVGIPAICDICRLTVPSGHTAPYYFYDWIQENIAKSAHPEASTCSKVD